MKILVISDTHKRTTAFYSVLEKVGPIDMLVHCGDVEGDEEEIAATVECECVMVAGNNDFFSDLPRDEYFYVGDYKVWVTHGHTHYVSMGNERIKEEAIGRGCNVVMYGHSHRPIVDMDDDVIAINPGSLSYPRQENHRPSYIVIDVDEAGELHFEICYL